MVPSVGLEPTIPEVEALCPIHWAMRAYWWRYLELHQESSDYETDELTITLYRYLRSLSDFTDIYVSYTTVF